MMIERLVIGQTFRAPVRPGGNRLHWRIDSQPLWAATGERFVWVKAMRVDRKRPWRLRPWPVAELPGALGDDLRLFYQINPHLPERAS